MAILTGATASEDNNWVLHSSAFDSKQLQYSVYYPSTGTAPFPCVIALSTWNSGTQFKDTGTGASAPYNIYGFQGLIDAGIAIITTNYRGVDAGFGSGGVNSALHDIKAFLRTIKLNTGTALSNIDPDRIGMIAGSRGANLILQAALQLGYNEGNLVSEGATYSSGDDNLTLDSVRVKGVCAFYPTLDATLDPYNNDYPTSNSATSDWYDGQPDEWNKYAGVDWEESSSKDRVKNIKEKLRAQSPSFMLNGYKPPVLLLHGDADTTNPVSQSRDFNTRYAARGGTITYTEVSGAGHDPTQIFTTANKAAMVSFFTTNLV